MKVEVKHCSLTSESKSSNKDMRQQELAPSLTSTTCESLSHLLRTVWIRAKTCWSTTTTYGTQRREIITSCGANTFTIYCSHVGPIHLPPTAAMWGQYIYHQLQPCGANTFTIYCSHVGPIHLPSTAAMWGQYIYSLLQPCGANTFTVYCSHVGPIYLPSTAAMWGQYIYRLL